MFCVLDNENITSTNASEAVEKIPADKKGYGIMVLYVLLCTATAYKEQTNIYIAANSCLHAF